MHKTSGNKFVSHEGHDFISSHHIFLFNMKYLLIFHRLLYKCSGL
ncbi:protein of unknown function [Shewanella benthica]|uniref:Uncharacterized protein n=1 Tax=Shewanella benthica TaxID=43661 RepID=A0A330M767_9GAMM|nr:protein of unknown function [Shewanella benthica]